MHDPYHSVEKRVRVQQTHRRRREAGHTAGSSAPRAGEACPPQAHVNVRVIHQAGWGAAPTSWPRPGRGDGQVRPRVVRLLREVGPPGAVARPRGAAGLP